MGSKSARPVTDGASRPIDRFSGPVRMYPPGYESVRLCTMARPIGAQAVVGLLPVGGDGVTGRVQEGGVRPRLP